MKLEEKELRIIEYYGVNHQLKHFQSEVFELNEAIINRVCLYNNGCSMGQLQSAEEHIVEELADVQLMLNQFKRYYDISDTSIDLIMNEKANRQLERISNE